MKLTEAIESLEERKAGDSKGRETYTSREGAKKDTKKSFKGRVKTYDSIKAALSGGSVGQIFSTKAANRMYVISKGKWGKKSGRGKIAKGFTPGSATPSADFGSVRKHAARTLLRHGKGSAKLAAKYGSRSMKKAKGIGGKDGRDDKGD
jgi:hypothetical protein|tara:strand:+ start:3719 stop:4165 length:447 start_codon:yes stop_codon:yes gene_type:complete